MEKHSSNALVVVIIQRLGVALLAALPIIALMDYELFNGRSVCEHWHTLCYETKFGEVTKR